MWGRWKVSNARSHWWTDTVWSLLSVVAGLVVAFLFIAPLFATLAWDKKLGATPGIALIGGAVLVMVGTIIAGPGVPPRNLNRFRNALLVLGVVLSVVGGTIWQ
jgi:hypothetical protein